jgi:hypothetical protein
MMLAARMVFLQFIYLGMIAADILYSRKEYRSYYLRLWRHDAKPFLKRQLPWLGVSVLCLGMAGLFHQTANLTLIRLLFVLGSGAGLFSLLRLGWLLIDLLKFGLYFQVDFSGREHSELKYHLSFSEKDILFTEEDCETRVFWPYYISFLILGDALYLFDKDESPDIVPLRFFTEENQSLLIRLLQSKLPSYSA